MNAPQEYDAVVIGAGIAGLVASAVLAHEGKKVLLLEREDRPGGRAAKFYYEGYKLGFGAHLSEDPGSGTTAIMKYLGKDFPRGPINDGMPVFHEGKWMSMAEVLGTDKEELKKVIKVLIESDYSDFDQYEDIPLRDWIKKYTDSESVVKLFEFVSMVEGATTKEWDHAAAENLYVRKMHYQEARTAGFSFYPKYGWDGYFKDLEDVIHRNGGEIEYDTQVGKVELKNGKVVGVWAEPRKKMTPNTFNWEFINTRNVICTVPVWDIHNLIPFDQLPEWWVDKVKLVAADHHRAVYLGMYIASEEPIYAQSERELAAWFEGPRTGCPGWGFLNSAFDPKCAPEGKHLWVCGVYIPPHVAADRFKQPEWFAKIEEELEIMFQTIKKALWKQRHVVYEPCYVANKPGLMGPNRPSNTVPGAEGLVLSGDSYQGRMIGTDRAARQGLAAAEVVLDYKIKGLENCYRVW